MKDWHLRHEYFIIMYLTGQKLLPANNIRRIVILNTFIILLLDFMSIPKSRSINNLGWLGYPNVTAVEQSHKDKTQTSF